MDKDDQQGTSNTGNIAWLAGIIEGEGTLVLSAWTRNTRKDKNPKIGLQVKVYNTDGGIIRKSIQIIDSLGIKFYLSEREQKPMVKPGGEGHYSSPDSMMILTISRLQSVHDFLEIIRPWMFGNKAARADIMLRYLKNRFNKFETGGGGPRNTPYGEDDFALVREFASLGRTPQRARVEQAAA